MTGTLLNGYANGLFYILYRTFPGVMQKEGFDFNDEIDFARQFGVVRRTSRFTVQNGQQDNRLGVSEKILPGVSPLVFTKFLLENAAFISLSDIADGLPSYREIPVPIEMDQELSQAYNQFEQNLRICASLGGSGGMKAMGSLLQSLSVYPDMPYNQPPVLHPDTGEVLVVPPALGSESRRKEERLLELVRNKVSLGEKVLIYYHWTNRTDLGERLPRLLEEANIKTAVLTSSTTSSKNRESWINQKVSDGIDVLICNPTLVETGLDLLDFTTIVFYQVGYNLFTLRQASRRSWRLSQENDIEVYFMYYQNTIQEQALSLMATKLQASQAIEGKFSEEGLHAMSNNEDLLTQIANSVVRGIRHTIDTQVFEKISHTRVNAEEKETMMLDHVLYDGLTPRQIKELDVVEQESNVAIETPKSKFSSYTIFMAVPAKKKKKTRTTATEALIRDLFYKREHVANLF